MFFFEKYATVYDVLVLKEAEDPERALPIAIPRTANFEQLCIYMNDYKVSVMLLHDDKSRIDGIISQKDIIREIANYGVQVFHEPISNMASSNLISCNKYDKLKYVAAKMAQENIRHIIVEDDDDGVVGVISSSDIDLFAGEG